MRPSERGFSIRPFRTLLPRRGLRERGFPPRRGGVRNINVRLRLAPGGPLYVYMYMYYTQIHIYIYTHVYIYIYIYIYVYNEYPLRPPALSGPSPGAAGGHALSSARFRSKLGRKR